MHIVYPSVTRIEADVNVLFRKIVRDSIRGISELQLGAGGKSLAYGYDHRSERGHSVCIVFSVVFYIGGLTTSQSSSTERRHQADLRDYIRRSTPSNGRSSEDCISSSS